MRNLPDEGPIIVINAHKDRCDALALRAGLEEPLHIPLPDLSLQKINHYRNDLDKLLQLKGLRSRGEDVTSEQSLGRAAGPFRRTQTKAPTVIRSVLRSLWLELVKPILDNLGFSRSEASSTSPRPRIWWCPTGPLSFLPIHAAGIYGSSECETLPDYAISSYTPSITAITKHIRGSHPTDNKFRGLFLTSQPNVPGAFPIPGTTVEVRKVYEKAVMQGVRVLKLEGSELTIEGCLKHLAEFSNVHFACHGRQNRDESLRSRFLFHNGSLELSTIIKQDLQNANLAFLSACQTSTGDEKLSDEVVHLAAGMLAAGYRQVVGTMWSIGDSTAQEVADKFYDHQFGLGKSSSGCSFDGTQSARALHQALQDIRSTTGDSEESLLAWVPFVHFGY
ncbi:hypothetical protein NMY22_g10 [Coprinellus aureogranulatus]|nr:hypothetical protein NMY22_g10 [Coprinellus aureogranulatus]